jgi:hypothetical protein
MENSFEAQLRSIVAVQLSNPDIIERQLFLISIAGGQVLEGRFARGKNGANPTPDVGFQMLALITYPDQGPCEFNTLPKRMVKEELVTVRYSSVAAFSLVIEPEDRLSIYDYVS